MHFTGAARPPAQETLARLTNPTLSDHDLPDGLIRGDLCYVLNTCAMGKSGLVVRTQAMRAQAERAPNFP